VLLLLEQVVAYANELSLQNHRYIRNAVLHGVDLTVRSRCRIRSVRIRIARLSRIRVDVLTRRTCLLLTKLVHPYAGCGAECLAGGRAQLTVHVDIVDAVISASSSGSSSCATVVLFAASTETKRHQGDDRGFRDVVNCFHKSLP